MTDKNISFELIDEIRKKRPLIHCINNYVSASSVANIVSALGARPIMSEEISEVEEIGDMADALLLNLGTPSEAKKETMLRAGKKAKKLGKPIIFDPVGAGISEFRIEMTRRIFAEVEPDIIRANFSEIKAIAKNEKNSCGVDSEDNMDIDNKKSGKQYETEERIKLVKEVSRKYNCIVVMSGKEDIIGDVNNIYSISNGTPLMSRVSGTGCQLSALTAAYASVSKTALLKASLAAVLNMGIAGELALKKNKNIGAGSYGTAVIDEIFWLNKEVLKKEARYEKLE